MQDPNDQPLAGRVAIVTGGGWNIGRAIALRFARRGARVVVASRTTDRLHAVVEEITQAGGEGLAVGCDVTQLDQVEHLIARATERFGTVDILAACAGGSGAHARVDDVDPRAWHDVIANNLYGTFHCARCVLPILRQKSTGNILTFAGGGAFFPEIGVHATAYACAKAALCRFTDQLQAELLDTGIRVNCIEPGMVLHPTQIAAIEAEEERTGQPHPHRETQRPPERAAELAEFLVSEPGALLRGRIVSVDDTWWRDPAKVRAVEDDVTMYRLRRMES